MISYVECHCSFQSCKMKTLAITLGKLLPYSSTPSPSPVQITAPATGSLTCCSIRFFITTTRTALWAQVLQHTCFSPDQEAHAQIPQISLPTPYWQTLAHFTSPPDSRQHHLKAAREVPVPGEGRQWEAELTSCKQQGQQQEPQRRGLCSVITSRPRLSVIFMVKGRDGPQQFLVRQSVSSAAKYTLCPSTFFSSYLLFSSKPVTTGKWGKTC